MRWNGLKTGDQIIGQTNGSFGGRVGIIAHDDMAPGLVIGSARQIFDIADDGEFIVAGRTVARRSPNRFPAIQLDDGVSAHKLIDFVNVYFDVPVSYEQPYKARMSGEDSSIRLPRLHGKTVLVHSARGNIKKAKLRTSQARFRLKITSNRSPILFTDAIELVPLDEAPVSVAGESGSLVTTLDGEAIGLIVCGFEDCSFAAPLLPALDDRLTDWRIPSPDEFRTIYAPNEETTDTASKFSNLDDEEAKQELEKRRSMTDQSDPMEIKRNAGSIGDMVGDPSNDE